MLLVAVVAGALLVLGGAEHVYKARVRARRRRVMSTRLAAAVARADEEQERRHADARAGAELTSFLPAIKHPTLTGPGEAPARASRSVR